MRRPPRVLVTRAAHQASELAERLRELGAEPVVVPVIEIAEPESFAALDAALSRLLEFDWLVLTSVNAVGALARRLRVLDVTLGGTPKIAVIGAMTANAVEQTLGRIPDLVPERAVAESLAESLTEVAGPGVRFLLVRAAAARDVIPVALQAAGAAVTVVAAYRTVVPEGAVDKLRAVFEAPEGAPDAVAFTSASSVANFFALLKQGGMELPAGVACASIGPVTSAALRSEERLVDVESSAAQIEVLAREVLLYLHTK